MLFREDDNIMIGLFIKETCVKKTKLDEFELDDDLDKSKVKVSLSKKDKKLILTFGQEDNEEKKLISYDYQEWSKILYNNFTKVKSAGLFTSEKNSCVEMSAIKKIISSEPEKVCEEKVENDVNVDTREEAIAEIMDLFEKSPLCAVMNSSMKQTFVLKALNNIVINTIKLTMGHLGVSDKTKMNQIVEKCKDNNLLVDSKKKLNDGKGKGKISSYLMFCNAKRAEVRAQYPEMKITEISGVLGKMWKEISEKDKEQYKVLADKENEEREKNPSKKSSKKTSSKKSSSSKKEPKHKCSYVLARKGEECGTGVKSDEPNFGNEYYCSKHLKAAKSKEEKKSEKKASKKKEEKKSKKEIESDIEDEEEEVKKPVEKIEKKPVVKKVDVKKVIEKEIESDIDDDEEEEVKKPVEKKTKKPVVKKVDVKEVKKVIEKEIESDIEEDVKENDDEDEGIDDEFYSHLEKRLSFAELKKNYMKNGIIVDTYGIVWNKDTRKAEGRFKDGKVVAFTSIEKRTIELWEDNN